MKKMRIVICDNNLAEARFYESLCRDLAQGLDVSTELKLYTSTDRLLSDLESPEFCKRLDVIFFALAEDNLQIPYFIRDSGYANLITFLGGPEMLLPYEALFDTEVYNFVQKIRTPEHLERFSQIFQSASKAVSKSQAEKLALSYGGEIRQIDIDDIHYFEVKQHALIVHYGAGESFTFISSLAKMENNLKGRKFLRASRFHLISLGAVEKLTFGNILMRDGSNIPVGRKYYVELKNAMDKKAI